MSDKNLQKLIVILGVTASGKTDLSIKLARKFNGEIISADSRQIYKEFDIGTAKTNGRWMLTGGKRKFVAGGVVHHLIDIFDPKEDFNLSDYKKLALEKINEVVESGKLPFLVGGTALYLKAVLENWNLPKIGPNLALRRKLENKKIENLYAELQKTDPEAAAITSPANKRRIIRALEVIYGTGKKFSEQRRKGPMLFNSLKIGITGSKNELKTKILQRTDQMIKNGLAEEVGRLQKKYLWSLVPMQSIDYQEFKEYFEGTRGLSKTIALINQHHLAYAKRQMTWFKKDKDIHWVSPDSKSTLDQSIALIKNFLAAKQVL
ncbi:MAG: tRNA (adenosine(37)-N6)-dimethylallyltransferase MiaA [Parcubacteria group bacterium]|nr:tRNA (adenosine(37)-N6)-dimethylallyltransferase MiaA [Parcubacteria group bacterium]